MKRFLCSWSCLVLLLGFLQSCNTYEDGPAMSLHSPKNRLLSAKKITRYEVNGIDSTFIFDSILSRTDYKTNGMDWEENDKHAGTFGCSVESGCLIGSWEWRDSKNSIYLVFPIPKPDSVGVLIPRAAWDIQRLSKEEFWIATNVNGSNYYMEMQNVK